MIEKTKTWVVGDEVNLGEDLSEIYSSSDYIAQLEDELSDLKAEYVALRDLTDVAWESKEERLNYIVDMEVIDSMLKERVNKIDTIESILKKKRFEELEKYCARLR